MSKDYSDIEIEDSDDDLIIEESSSSFSSEIRMAETNILKGEKYKIFEKAKKTKTPIEFIFKIDGQIISSIEKISELDKNILDSYQYFFTRNIKISPKNFLMIFYIANKKKSKDYLIENFNYFSNLVGEENFYEENFRDYVKKMVNLYNFLMEKTDEEFIRFEQFFKKVQNLNYSQDSNKIIDSFQEHTVETEIKIKDGDYEFDLENSEIIFNNFQVSEQFEFIKMKTFKEKYKKDEEKYKIFNPSKNILEYILNNEEIEIETNTILIFYNIEINNVLHRDKIEINLNTGKMLIRYPSEGLDIIKNNIVSFYPTIRFLEEEEKNLVGDFQMSFKNYDETKIYYLTLNDPIFSEFIYIREDASPRSLKENLKYYYVGSEEKREKLNYSLYFYVNKIHGDNYVIQFNSKKHSPTLFREFIDIMNKLVFHYNEINYEEQINYLLITRPYKGNNSDGGLGGKEEDRIIKTKQRSKKKIDLLYTKNKKLFSKNIYAKSCSCQKQPVIISEEDVKDWENYEFNGKTRNVVLYPPANSNHKVQKDYYVCTDDEFTNLNLRRNPDMTSEYPLIPCCNKSYFPEDLYKDYDKIRKNQKLYWSKKEEYKGKGKNILKTLKVLSRGRLGRIHEDLENLLKSIQKREYIREGISKNSTSSFFEIIYYIIREKTNFKLLEKDFFGHETYFELIKKENFRNKTLFVEFSRNQILDANENLYYYFCGQEVFDLNKEDFIDIFKNPKNEFNSRYFYKILESILKLNVFVFVYDKITDTIEIEIPNCNRYHIREIREELPCIFVLKHKKDPFNVYELIRLEENSFFEETKSKYIFPSKFTKYMKNYFEAKSYNTVEIFNENQNTEKFVLEYPVVRKNPYNNINWNKIFINYKIISQYLNYSGRILKLDIQYSKDENKKMSIFTVPAYPVFAVGDVLDVYTPPIKDIIKVFGDKYEKGENGLWYRINDFKYGIFIPCKEKNITGKICQDFELLKNILIQNKIENNIKVSKKNSNIFIQTIIWLYLLERIDFEVWIKKYLYKDTDFPEEIFKTNLINIPYRFPIGLKNTAEGIDYLSNHLSKVFRKNKIFLYPKLFDSVISFMKNNFLKNNYGNIQYIKNNNVINNIFTVRSDYSIKKYTAFIFDYEYDNWKSNQKKNVDINTINDDQKFKKESFVWKDPKSKVIYLIQNNLENSKICSYIISVFWDILKTVISPGYKITTKNAWETFKLINENTLEKYMNVNFKILKEYVKKETGKNLYFENLEKCFDYLLVNKIPYKVDNQYSYVVFSKVEDDVVIVEKNIIDTSGTVYRFFRYEDGGYASMLPI